MLFAPFRRRFLSLVGLVVLSACTGAKPVSPHSKLADFAIAENYNGVVLMRPDRSSTELIKTFGMAEFELSTPVTAKTRFMVGSVSKWITTAAVLRLVEQGKLDLDKPITTWLPELPAASQRVTLRALLSNTSGIENGLDLALKRDRSAVVMTISPAEAALLYGSGPLVFTPGTKFDYSVTNWLLVAGIVERATGEAFTHNVQRLVFEPAGLTDTGFVDRDGLAPHLAVAYDASHTVRKTTRSPPMVAASGTMYSTASDLVKLADVIYGNVFLSASSRKELLSVQHAPEEYALGGRVKQLGDESRSRLVAWETGVSGGYKTLLAYSPLDGRAVVLLNNTDMQQSEQAKLGLAILYAMDK